MSVIEKLCAYWEISYSIESDAFMSDEILSFEKHFSVKIPKDLVAYFKIISSIENKTMDDLFCFYGIDSFRTVHEELKDWVGVPNYQSVLLKIQHQKNYFVFCDYSMHINTYAIQLHANSTKDNDVIVLSGDEYSVIANSFSDFVKLYVAESESLYL